MVWNSFSQETAARELSMKASIALVVLAVVACSSSTGMACPTCYGAPDSATTEAMNMAIISLLGITGGVLAGVVSFVVYLRRRATMINGMFSNRLN